MYVDHFILIDCKDISQTMLFRSRIAFYIHSAKKGEFRVNPQNKKQAKLQRQKESIHV